MLNYSLSSVIPTKSFSKGLITDTNLIFTNNTFVFSFNDKPMLIGTVKSDILSIKNLQSNYLISTQNKIYLMNKKGEILHSFRKEVNFIETFGEKVYFVSKNILQIYSLGKDYRLNLENNIYIHSEDINFFKRIEDLFFTCSTDRSLKLFYKNNFMTIGKFRSKIINLFVINFDPFTLQIITEGGIRYQEVYCFDYFNKTFVKKEKNFENINNIFLPGKICAAVKKENCVYYVHTEEETKKLVFFENDKIKCEYEIQEEFYEMEIYKNEVILKNENGIKAFTNLDNTLIDKVDFPEVICMAEERNKVVLGCTDKFIRTYDDTYMFSKLKDEKSLGSFFSVHKIKNVIFSVTGSGYVSVFDLNNNVCFRSFHVECRVSGSALNEDGSLLFLSNFDTNEIYVIDVLRSKKVDTIDNGAPIIKMTMFKSFLYVLSTESIIKYDLYNSSHVSITFSGNSLTFGENLAACTDKSVYIFDTNLNITSILDCKLIGKNSSEKFNKNKPITKISFDHLGNILCSGCVNQIYMLNDKESKKYNVCFNETLENYKDFFTKKEENKIFNEENLIETKELIHSQNSPTFYVLSKHALLIYKIKESKILFDSLDTQESAENLFAKKDFISALFLALKLNLTELTRNIVRKTIFIPNFNEELLEKLAKIVVRMIEENDSLDNSLVWLKNILKQIQLSDDDKNKIRIILEKLRFNGWMMFKKAYKENKKVFNK